MAEVMSPQLMVGEKPLRKVARRKVMSLGKAIRLTDPTLEELLASGILQEPGLEALRKLRDGERMPQLVDNLNLETNEGRQHFLNFVESKSPWLHEEIMVEIRAETGSLLIDDAEVEDASFLVHRHFGTSRRFAEEDKRIMTSLVATKAQVTKEVWSRRLAAAKQEVEKLRREIEEREKLIRSTNETIKTFVKRNEIGLYDFSMDNRSTSEILKSSKEQKETVVNDLVRRTNFVLQKFARILLDRENLTKQKDECLTILKLDDQRAPLHVLIRDTISHLSRENATTRDQLKVLRVKAIDLEEQLNTRDLQIAQLRAEVKELRSRTQPATTATPLADEARGDVKEVSRTSTPKPTTPENQSQKTTTKSLPPIPKTRSKSTTTNMWPRAREGKAKRCLLEM